MANQREMIDSIRDWMDDRASWLVPTAIVILTCLCLCALYFSERQWQDWAAKHHCVKVAETAPQTTVDSRGHTITIPSTTSYKCDDGITYTR